MQFYSAYFLKLIQLLISRKKIKRKMKENNNKSTSYM